VAVLAFDLHRSDLPLQIAFPLLLSHLVGWLAPGTGATLPAQIAPVAEAFADVPIICAHSGANNIPSNALDAILLARTHANVYLGTSWVQMPELVEMYYAIGAGKIVYESDCSPQAMGQTLRMVTNLHLPPPLGVGASKDEVYRMIGGNAAQLCNIPLD
jgi:predicted TIM-barrel fold metal-dependent hydrolase